MSKVRVPCLIAAVLLLAGCNTTTKSGSIGTTLSGGGVSVSVNRIDLSPRVPARDITGMSTPAPGDRLIGARVRVCSNEGAAIGTYDFTIGLADGSTSPVKFPQMNYAKQFDSVRTGCAAGWIEFDIPASSPPSEIRFAFDNTGDEPGSGGHQPESHQRFSWKLA